MLQSPRVLSKLGSNSLQSDTQNEVGPKAEVPGTEPGSQSGRSHPFISPRPQPMPGGGNGQGMFRGCVGSTGAGMGLGTCTAAAPPDVN